MYIDTTVETVFKGRDNIIARQFTNNGKAITNHSTITRIILNIGDIVVDSQANPEMFTLGLADRIELKLGTLDIPINKYLCTITAYSPSSTSGTSYPPFILEFILPPTSLL